MSASAILLNVLCLIMVYGLNSTCFRAYLQGKKTGRNDEDWYHFKPCPIWDLSPFSGGEVLNDSFEWFECLVMLQIYLYELTLSLCPSVVVVFAFFFLWLPYHTQRWLVGVFLFFSRLAQVDVRDGDPPRGLELRPVGHTPSPLHCVR